MKDGAEARFWAKVDRSGDCWIWTGSKVHFGYGQFWSGERIFRAHRFSYILHYGDIPGGVFVCHRCDVPACVNPAHLFLGTAADNSQDKAAKGRVNKSFRPMIRYSDDHIKLIRELRSSGMKVREISRMMGISPSYVSELSRGRFRKPPA